MAAPYPNMAPTSKLIFEKSSFLHKNSRHEKFVEEHYFNASVSVVLPGESIPDEMTQVFEEEEAYIIHSLPALRLIDKEFIEAFVKKGSMYMLSNQTRLDCHDCAALLPTGKLILHLTKDTYEQLGIEGRPSKFTQRHTKPSKYVVEIDLFADHFMPGRKIYNRVWSCLKDRQNLVFDFLVTWFPQDEKICPSSIQKYFASQDYEVSSVPVNSTRRLLQDRLTPELTPGTEHTDLYEWLGAVMCDVSLDGEADNYLTTYHSPEPAHEKTLGVFRATGVISPLAIGHLIEVVRRHVNGGKGPWCAINVHGFSDAPVCRASREHGFHLSGDSLYTIVVFPDHRYWLYTALSSHDHGY